MVLSQYSKHINNDLREINTEINKKEYYTIDLSHVAKFLWAKAWLVALAGILCAAIGFYKNAITFCLIISLSGPILGREALGWFVDMSAIGASIGFFFTSASSFKKMRADNDGGTLLKLMSVIGMVFSIIFMVLQLVPIPTLNGAHFCKESYLMLIVWIVLGLVCFLARNKVKARNTK